MQRLITFQIISQWRLKCFDNHIFNHFFLEWILNCAFYVIFKNQHTVHYLLWKLFLSIVTRYLTLKNPNHFYEIRKK